MYTERPPAPPLARAVRAAWASRAVNGATTVRPDGCTDLIFHQSSSGHLTLRVRGVMTTPLQVSGDGGRRARCSCSRTPLERSCARRAPSGTPP